MYALVTTGTPTDGAPTARVSVAVKDLGFHRKILLNKGIATGSKKGRLSIAFCFAGKCVHGCVHAVNYSLLYECLYQTTSYTSGERRSLIQSGRCSRTCLLQQRHRRKDRPVVEGRRSHRQTTNFLSVDFLARQRDTIARTLEPTREQDSRNVLGPTKDHRPCCWVPVHALVSVTRERYLRTDQATTS